MQPIPNTPGRETMTLDLPIQLAAVLENARLAKEVSPGIWGLSNGTAEGRAQYDSIASAYDFVGGLDIYHRVFWGVSTATYREFAWKARNACGKGLELDAGCGSMLFSARTHRRNELGDVIGADASLEMLKLARNRLGGARQPSHVALLHANILRSPIRPAIFDVVVCLHVAHVIRDLEGLIGELRRILKPGGKLFLTSVVLVNQWRDAYLRVLSRRGMLASPRRIEDILGALRTAFETEPEYHVIGSMLFVETPNLRKTAAIRTNV
jgi:phosphatidylethanolamine/phosphatidyl-N-methylethanolamine N-methyltransferase